jgi:hypothetical protein
LKRPASCNLAVRPGAAKELHPALSQHFNVSEFVDMAKFIALRELQAGVIRAQRLNRIMQDLHSATDRELKELQSFYGSQIQRATLERLRVNDEILRRCGLE